MDSIMVHSCSVMYITVRGKASKRDKRYDTLVQSGSLPSYTSTPDRASSTPQQTTGRSCTRQIQRIGRLMTECEITREGDE